MMWNRSWGIGAFKTLPEYAAKNAEYMARLAGLIYHSSGEEGRFPHTAEMARELAICTVMSMCGCLIR